MLNNFLVVLSDNKERGASCALVGSIGQSNSCECSFGKQQYESNLRSARTASNSAMASFYKSPLWHAACARKDDEIKTDIAAMLHGVRQQVDGAVEDENDVLFFHDVFVEYNKFLSCVIQAFVVNEVSERKVCEQRKFSDLETKSELRRNAKVTMSLLELILSFVKLKESLGIERATLSGLMASGLNKMRVESNEPIESHSDGKLNHDGARLNMVVNDLVMVVENQHQIMRGLQKQSGLRVFGSDSRREDTRLKEADISLVGNDRALLMLVSDSIRPSDAMHALQDHIRKDFDIDGFRRAMPMDEFWHAITLYMDKLHAMELFILEELENCEGCFDSLDLLSLQDETMTSLETLTAGPPSTQTPPKSNEANKPELKEWEISLYEVDFLKRSKQFISESSLPFILGNL